MYQAYFIFTDFFFTYSEFIRSNHHKKSDCVERDLENSEYENSGSHDREINRKTAQPVKVLYSSGLLRGGVPRGVEGERGKGILKAKSTVRRLILIASSAVSKAGSGVRVLSLKRKSSLLEELEGKTQQDQMTRCKWRVLEKAATCQKDLEQWWGTAKRKVGYGTSKTMEEFV